MMLFDGGEEQFRSNSDTNYVPIRCLGKGAFGEATLYRKTIDNSLVVWKEVDLSGMDTQQQQAALSEVEILSSLPPHPNIVQYLTHFHSYPPEQPMLLIEMEYANGGDLQKFIGRATYPLSEQTVTWFFYQLMAAVSHIHAIPILHRDIKTMNIFITTTGASAGEEVGGGAGSEKETLGPLLKLGDFGISKRLEGNSHMAQTVVGTPYYMSPELMQGLVYDQKSDIWACGCVLFELMTLKKSFDATNALRLAHDVVHGRIQVEGVNREVYSKPLWDLVDKMLNTDPNKRPSAEEVTNDVTFENSKSLYVSVIETVRSRLLSSLPSSLQFGPAPFSGSPSSSASWSQQTSLSSLDYRSLDFHSSSSLSFHGSGASFSSNPTIASQSSEVFCWGGGKLTPAKIEHFSAPAGRGGGGSLGRHQMGHCTAIGVAVGSNMMAAISLERELYTWTPSGCTPDANTGQLGHGGVKSQRRPRQVEGGGMGSRQVQQVACGSEFTLILTRPGFGLMPKRRIKVKISRRNSLAGFRLSIAENPETSELPPTHGRGSLTPFATRRARLSDTPHTSLEADKCLFFCGMMPLELEDQDEDETQEAGMDETASPNTTENDEQVGNSVSANGNNSRSAVLDVTCPVLAPVLLPCSINNRVKFVACGSNHCAAITESGELFTWGCGEFGRLGLGHESDVMLPQKVKCAVGRNGKKRAIEEPVAYVCCGVDCTICLTGSGLMMSCGNNEHNKIGQNIIPPKGVSSTKKMGFDAPSVLNVTVAKTVANMRFTSADCGCDHSALIDVHGRVLTLGDNSRGQLGMGGTSGSYSSEAGGVNMHVLRGVFVGKKCQRLSCGDYFTVAATSDNEVFAWGLASDGRLGFDPSTLSTTNNASGRSSSSSVNRRAECIVNRPKPVFGALHSVTALASAHWHTLLIAERVESVKSINVDPVTLVSCADEWNDRYDNSQIEQVPHPQHRYNNHSNDTTSSLSSSVFDSGDGSVVGGVAKVVKVRAGVGVNQSTLEETETPDWLREEMDEAEFIAMSAANPQNVQRAETEDGGKEKTNDGNERKLSDGSQTKSGEDVENGGDAWESAGETSGRLSGGQNGSTGGLSLVSPLTGHSSSESEINWLRQENQKLQEIIQEQQERIKQLELERDAESSNNS